MMTADLSPQAVGINGTARQLLMNDPSWRWANRLLGDPLLRADDKALAALGGAPGSVLGRLAASLRDPATRSEIRSRGEAKLRALQLQLSELRRRGLPDLAMEAEREISDQEAFIQAFADQPASA